MKVIPIPCAIYTRKSSEEGLEQGFNSLDAQREACAAYILSQKALGWTTVASDYDDGGFSGGTLERPAVKRLLADIGSQRVRVVVVYKVDRLTRSLADFAKMVELFDEHGVSFVSVTQQFNTTTSMGRLTLNVLLSFAQFEREVTGERIRDKIAASKRKGMWMGGIPAVGYLANDRSLAIDESQAERVREIFRLYLQFNCVRRLKAELDRRGWLTPVRKSRRAGGGGGRSFSRGHLYRLLSNPVYIGKIAHKDQVFDGNHPAIIDLDLWEAVQERLAANQTGHRAKVNLSDPSLLAGMLFDEKGCRLTPSHAKKGSKRYRYYVGGSEGKPDGGQVLRIPAHGLEVVVMEALTVWLNDPSRLMPWLEGLDARATRDALQRARDLAAQIKLDPQTSLTRCLQRITVGETKVNLTVALDAIETTAAERDSATAADRVAEIGVPVQLKRCGLAVRLIVHGPGAAVNRAPDARMIALISKAHDWFGLLRSGQCDSISAIADKEGVTGSYVTRVVYLAFLAPDLVQSIVRGEHPPQLSAHRLMSLLPLPDAWAEQRELLGFG